ncbi:MAG: class I SAM-dependent methyltransferase [Isosphaeraceae bacterium]
MNLERLAGLAEVGRVVGVEPSAAALGHSARRWPGRVVRGDALSLPFADVSFDLVTCFDVLQHLPPGGDVRALRAFARVLRPGGIVLVRSNGRGWSGDESSYRLRGLTGRFERAGFRVLRASYVNCLPSMLQELRGRFPSLSVGARRRAGRSRPHPSGGGLRIAVPAAPVNRAMGVAAGVEAFLAGNLAVPLPFGHSTLVLARKSPDG